MNDGHTLFHELNESKEEKMFAYEVGYYFNHIGCKAVFNNKKRNASIGYYSLHLYDIK